MITPFVMPIFCKWAGFFLCLSRNACGFTQTNSLWTSRSICFSSCHGAYGFVRALIVNQSQELIDQHTLV